MNELIIMSASFCIAQLLPDFLQPFIFRLKKKFKIRRLKPFDCSACLSFWLTLNLSLTETNIKFSILYAAIVFYLTMQFELKKLE